MPQNYFGCPGSFVVPHKFKIVWTISAQNAMGNINKGCIESVDHFWWYRLLNSVNSSSPWAQKSFHLFVFSSISFIDVLQFSEYSFFTSLVKFTPKYFILLGAIINGNAFLIPLPGSLLLVYRSITDFLYSFVLYNFTELIS